MEEGNSKVFYKGLVLLFLVILILSIYREEVTKKEVARIAETVQDLKAQLESNFSEISKHYVSSDQFDSLAKEVSSIKSIVAFMQEMNSKIAGNQTIEKSSIASSSESRHSSKDRVNTSLAYGHVTVSAKAKAENRYITSSILPKVSSGPEGIVCIGISIDNLGQVVASKVSKGTNIVDEDILEVCKEAALRCRFSKNFDAPMKQPGTITYTFSAK